MNAFNRIILLIVALLLLVVPVAILLVALGMVSADLADQYTAYRAGVSALEPVANLSLTETPVRVVVGIVGALVAIITLLLLLRELTLGRIVSRSAVVDDTPGMETRLTSRAIRSLAEGAAREVGAGDASASLTSKGRPYLVQCSINVPEDGNYTEIASRARENVRRVLEGQSVPVKEVEVTVHGAGS